VPIASPFSKTHHHSTKAINDEGGDMNVAFDTDHGASQSEKDTIPGVAKRLKARGQPWALVVDENYGEGSAREHAALQPRFYGTYIYDVGDLFRLSPVFFSQGVG
jgi:aconitase A